MQLSPHQSSVLSSLFSYCVSPTPSPYITLCGYAGTGKTTLISALIDRLSSEYPTLKVTCVAPTGKAASVLRAKGIPAITLHALIYRCVSMRPLRFERRSRIEDFDVLIVDESSMLDSVMLKDILSYSLPVIFCGDGFQLPPINNDPKLLETPDHTLHEVFRNDGYILSAATAIRTKGKRLSQLQLPTCNYDYIRSVADLTEHQIICGRNNTRTALNNQLAKQYGKLSVGDKVIILKNNHERGISNGELFLVDSLDEDTVTLSSCITGELLPPLRYCTETFRTKKLPFRPSRDLIYLDHGYVITCHKSQGSEFDTVICIPEAFGTDSDILRRWEYTAITRAKSNFFLLS